MRKTARETTEMLWAAPFVMGMRLSRMMLPDAMRTAKDRAEDVRMVEEKAKSAVDGIVAANIELGQQMMNAWLGMAFGKKPNMARAADAIVAAGLKPARRKVKANVKRLAKRGTK